MTVAATVVVSMGGGICSIEFIRIISYGYWKEGFYLEGSFDSGCLEILNWQKMICQLFNGKVLLSHGCWPKF